jgi:hypothetical protein
MVGRVVPLPLIFCCTFRAIEASFSSSLRSSVPGTVGGIGSSVSLTFFDGPGSFGGDGVFKSIGTTTPGGMGSSVTFLITVDISLGNGGNGGCC